ncbi:hypothetical protein H8B09_01870 [Paenibacillus sp. PR3]|uniref:Lipoprotein n=1 Tax=Paenibacillus terricola TaxID=2763503 RepID=A0ABR8MNA0_9BACL|nr:hypothetical protein [Paenibacillus terricola]MBD3917487.1 hypothetical protein [Paenibacillus terricola]
MKRFSILLTAVLPLLLLTACGESHSDKNAARHGSAVSESVLPVSTETKDPDLEKIDPYTLVEETSADLNHDGSKEEVSTYTMWDDANQKLSLKIRIDEGEQHFEIHNPRKLTSIAPIKSVNLNNGNKGLLILFYSEEEEQNRNKNDLYSGDFSGVVVTYLDKKIELALNLFEAPYRNENNYELKYVGDSNIHLVDHATGFTSDYKAYVSEVDKDESEKLFQILDSLNIPSAMANKQFYKIVAEDTDKDGVDEIIASTNIPGVKGNDVLGVIDYHYRYEAPSYRIAKEELWHNKVLDEPLIQEQTFDS